MRMGGRSLSGSGGAVHHSVLLNDVRQRQSLAKLSPGSSPCVGCPGELRERGRSLGLGGIRRKGSDGPGSHGVVLGDLRLLRGEDGPLGGDPRRQ